MKHITKFKNFNEEKEIGFFDWITGDKDDNKVINQIISRLKKANPLNNPYPIKELPSDDLYSSLDKKIYEIEFDDIKIKIQYYQSGSPSGRIATYYSMWFKPSFNLESDQEEDYKLMRPRTSLIKSLFKIVDKLLKKPGAKSYLNQAADLL